MTASTIIGITGLSLIAVALTIIVLSMLWSKIAEIRAALSRKNYYEAVFETENLLLGTGLSFILISFILYLFGKR